MTAEPVTIIGSELHIMESQSTGRQYRITISLPLGYSAAAGEAPPFHNTPEKWPVVYVLDGNWHFGLVTDMTRQMQSSGRTTDAIIVGIGYVHGNDPMESVREPSSRRSYDLSPLRDEQIEKMLLEYNKRPSSTGDAGNFLKFIKDELIPFVETNYRADPSRRILAGHSLGGLFALYCMFEAPGLFESLIIGSPALFVGNRFAFQLEETFAKEHRKLPAKVYLFVGDLEEGPNYCGVTDVLRLAAILQGRNYEGFSLAKQVIPDQTHNEVVTAGYQAGLKFALKFKVYLPPVTGTNIAFHKLVTISSPPESDHGDGTCCQESFVNNGDASTRWASSWSDPQWIQIDLGSVQSFHTVQLAWEAAYATAYQIQTSNDATNWTTIYATTTGVGGVETLDVSGSGRYVRMNGTARATIYGYSLWEFGIYQ